MLLQRTYSQDTFCIPRVNFWISNLDMRSEARKYNDLISSYNSFFFSQTDSKGALDINIAYAGVQHYWQNLNEKLTKNFVHPNGIWEISDDGKVHIPYRYAKKTLGKFLDQNCPKGKNANRNIVIRNLERFYNILGVYSWYTKVYLWFYT